MAAIAARQSMSAERTIRLKDHINHAWSNELVLHVVELKTNGPAPSLAGLQDLFLKDAEEINGILSRFGGTLLPTAMHPWMDPETETTLWPYEFSPVYQAYDGIFGCRGHGWSNLLQSIPAHLLKAYCNENRPECWV